MQICACVAPLRPAVLRFIKFLRKQRHPSKLPKSTASKSSSTNAVNTTQSKLSTAEISEWTSIIWAVDLEGIGTDNYGYKVMISGPPRKKRWEKGIFRALTVNLLRSKAQTRQEATVQETRVPITTEVIVSHSRHLIPQSGPKNASAAPNFDIEAAMPEFELQYLSYPSLTASDDDDTSDFKPNS
jgi:hypothetical protein